MDRRTRIALTGWVCLIVLPLIADARMFQARLDRVADGDSMWVKDERGVAFEVRIIGIDAPERHQPFADESRASLRRLLQNCRLTVNVVRPDTHNRLLAGVTCNGVDAGFHQIASGVAWLFPRERAISDSQRRRYAEAERVARAQRKGLWRAAQPVPPWQFRRDQRETRSNRYRHHSALPQYLQ